MSQRRPKLTWDVNRLIELQRTIDVVLSDYVSQCYEAQDRAPESWRQYWADEAEYVHRLRSSMCRRVQDFIDYAGGHNVEMISPNDARTGRTGPPAE